MSGWLPPGTLDESETARHACTATNKCGQMMYPHLFRALTRDLISGERSSMVLVTVWLTAAPAGWIWWRGWVGAVVVAIVPILGCGGRGHCKIGARAHY